MPPYFQGRMQDFSGGANFEIFGILDIHAAKHVTNLLGDPGAWSTVHR